jgi:hypothetical protein
VEVTLSAEPLAARFLVDGSARDCNPCTLAGAPGSTHHVRAQAEHFVAAELDLRLESGAKEQHLVLAPEPSAAAVHKAPAVKRPTTGLSVDEKNPYQ